ncbi:hypothetical protein HNQ65_000300 [Prosthecobacter vanneervenii]|uniref:Uncharacterized protein n=1 Tax=Prosthecobacter vanneervenii TaxID=48466 RepID=A0A7W7Y710_9BACT|nr:hypothetical protein [Prosthecobacter vanneervenii]
MVSNIAKVRLGDGSLGQKLNLMLVPLSQNSMG